MAGSTRCFDRQGRRGKNNGMMEYWNDNLKKMTFLYLIPVKRNFTITQLSIFPKPNIPTFSRYIAG